jgi:hypothetical protein
MDTPLRDGWEESNSGAYDFVVDDALRGYVVGMFDGYGWMVVALAGGRGGNSHMCRMDTVEEAMIWVEMTYALSRG